MDPFLKWAGGKRWLVSAGALPLPRKFDRYVEPFLGGGAVFFHLAPRKAFLSDVNADLIEAYAVIRESASELTTVLRRHHDAHSREYYYTQRGTTHSDPIERAARLIYLNRTCWNGLYRVNQRGQFNVPIGTKDWVLSPKDDFQQLAQRLAAAELRCCDFEETIDGTEAGDFLFLDPPYTVKHNMNGFLKYNERIFHWVDQVRLRDAVVRAKERGVSIVMTNADHESIHDLYEGVLRRRTLTRSSVLAGSATKRGSTTEALLTANV